MNNITVIKKLPFLLLIPLGVLLVHFASVNPESVEKLYSEGIYRHMGSLLSTFTGFFPFSVAEALVILTPVLILFYLSRSIYTALTHPGGSALQILNSFTNVLIAVSVGYFLFVILWGLNYYRLPYPKITDLDVRPASLEELEAVCISAIEKANLLRSRVNEDRSGVMEVKEAGRQLFLRAKKGYQAAARIVPQLEGRYGTPKGVMLSIGLTYSGIAGIYFPFTGEANVNTMVPDCLLPSTACHEMAHQRGFAREDEANYIAYWTCSLHPDPDFQYSGTLLAMIHATKALRDNDPDRYARISKLYSQGVLRDLKAHNAFWQRYEGPVERTSNKINNAYLKANKQKDGVQSYGRMVDLLIAEYRKAHRSK